MSELDDVADELYAGPPAEFVARRAAAVKAARADKDRELADAIGELRKPTVSAWLVNLLVRDDPAMAGQIVALGEGLRDAERSLDGPALRELSSQRRQLVRSLVARARRLAQPTGQKIGDAVVQELDATLTAALADPAVAREVVSGRLTAAREYAGFGSADTAEGATPPAPPTPPKAPKAPKAPSPPAARDSSGSSGSPSALNRRRPPPTGNAGAERSANSAPATRHRRRGSSPSGPPRRPGVGTRPRSRHATRAPPRSLGRRSVPRAPMTRRTTSCVSSRRSGAGSPPPARPPRSRTRTWPRRSRPCAPTTRTSRSRSAELHRAERARDAAEAARDGK